MTVDLIQWADGNFGAASFLVEIARPQNVPYQHDILTKLGQLNSIRGTNLYILWSDLCERDMNKVHDLCTRCPDDVLTDACSRQDYSGLQLVKKYFSS